MKSYYPSHETCRRLGICRKTLYNWKLQGVPFVYVFGYGTGVFLFNLRDVKKWAVINGKNKR